MRIGIDPWTLASRFRFQGTYVYAQKLIAEFKKLGPSRPDLEFCLFAGTGDGNDARTLVESRSGFELCETRLLSNDPLWRFGGLGLAASQARCDLIFAPTASSMPFSRAPLVCTIHDVTPVVMPSHSIKATLLLRSLLWSLARFSRKIITDSECSRRDIMRIYGVPESRIAVIYLGYDKTVFNLEPTDPEKRQELLTRIGVSKPYILHHGTIQPRKNLVRLIEAYRLVLSRNSGADFELVLPGRMGWEYQEIMAAANKSGPGRVIFAGTLSDQDLAMLIKGSHLVAIPSLYEGFCLPMVESMACGTPTVVSGTSCLPEVSGNALEYFDPRSVEDIASRMESVLFDSELRERLSRRGRERAAQFSWERCARETLDVLVSAATQGKN